MAHWTADIARYLLPILAGVLMGIAWAAYVRRRTTRMLLWAVAFSVYFAKTVVNVVLAGTGEVHEGLGDLLDLAILSLLFAATVRQ